MISENNYEKVVVIRSPHYKIGTIVEAIVYFGKARPVLEDKVIESFITLEDLDELKKVEV